MNRRVFAIVFALLLGNAVAFAQKPSSSVVVLSVGDILGNYGLDSAWVNDTSAVIAHLNAQPQDYVALTNLCVSIRTNAELFHKTYDEELHRVIIHGILHLCGINDKGPGEREIMEAAENKALELL